MPREIGFTRPPTVLPELVRGLVKELGKTPILPVGEGEGTGGPHSSIQPEQIPPDHIPPHSEGEISPSA